MRAIDLAAAELHDVPPWRVVMHEQILATGLLLRVAGALFSGALVLLVGISARIAVNAREVAALRHTTPTLRFTYSPGLAVVFLLIALLFPLIVWQDEDPTRRTYHLAMPVSRRTHALTKVFSGWVWLMLASVMLLIAIEVVHQVTQNVTGVPQPYATEFVWWEWLIPFTAATIGYLLSSSAVVVARRPLVWILGVAALYYVAGIAFYFLGMQTALYRLDRMLHGFLGVMAALAGEITWGKAELPNAARWLGSTVVWGAIAITLLVAMSQRRSGAR